jgi:hypothetical protein
VDTNPYGLPLYSPGTVPYYRGRFATRCLGRKRKPVHVSSIEIWATLSNPASNNGSHPVVRQNSARP